MNYYRFSAINICCCFFCWGNRYRNTLSKNQKFCQNQPIFFGYIVYFFRSVSIWRGSYASESSTYLFHQVDLYISVVFSVTSLWILLLPLLPLRFRARTHSLAHCFYLFIFIAGLLRLLLYIKFSNQLEQCCAWVCVCLSAACVRAAEEGRRRPYTQIDLLHFAIKIPIHKKHAMRKYKSTDP